jgi:hypothetical protein
MQWDAVAEFGLQPDNNGMMAANFYVELVKTAL